MEIQRYREIVREVKGARVYRFSGCRVESGGRDADLLPEHTIELLGEQSCRKGTADNITLADEEDGADPPGKSREIRAATPQAAAKAQASVRPRLTNTEEAKAKERHGHGVGSA
jgi:hypothetical protein